jgi:NAD(P)H dehydrogenase (quinone)
MIRKHRIGFGLAPGNGRHSACTCSSIGRNTMSVVVTGATGHLGRDVLEALLRRGVPAGEIVALGRKLDSIKDFTDRGVRAVQVDYSDREGLRSAFEGAEKLLLISGSEVGQRVPQHTNVIEAAKAAGVRQIAYTSILGIDTTTMGLADEHKVTEALLVEADIPFTLLRNGWYLDNYLGNLTTALPTGVIQGSAGEGRISGAARADFAEAAATVLTSDGHQGARYELGGDETFTMAELAARITELTGTQVTYQNLPPAEYEQVLISFGLPAAVASMVADNDRAVSEGELETHSGDLSRLLGRPTTTLPDALKAAAAG